MTRFLKDIDGNDTMYPVVISANMKQEILRLWGNYIILESGYKQGVFGKETLKKMQSQIVKWIEEIKSGYGYSESKVL